MPFFLGLLTLFCSQLDARWNLSLCFFKYVIYIFPCLCFIFRPKFVHRKWFCFSSFCFGKWICCQGNAWSFQAWGPGLAQEGAVQHRPCHTQPGASCSSLVSKSPLLSACCAHAIALLALCFGQPTCDLLSLPNLTLVSSFASIWITTEAWTVVSALVKTSVSKPSYSEVTKQGRSEQLDMCMTK